MSDNSKINASLKEKIRFIILTYLITSTLWTLSIFLCIIFMNHTKDIPLWEQLSNADTYKVVVSFLFLFFIGKRMNRLSNRFTPFVALLRFGCITAILICINIRWNIDPYSTEFWSYSIKIGLQNIQGKY